MTGVSRLRGTGALVILGFVALMWIAVARPNPFADHVTVRARFDHAARIAGVIDRNVRIGGVNVGEIAHVGNVGDDAIVEMRLDPDKAGKIARDARAELRPHTLFEGSSFVDLDPGSASAPALGDGVIGLSRTRNYVSMDEVLRLYRPDTRNALQDDVRDLARGLAPGAPAGVQRMLRGLPSLYRDLAPAARASRGVRGDELSGAIRGLSRTVAALASREQDLAPLLRDGGRTFAAYDVDAGEALDATLANTPAALEAMASGGAQLERIVDRLEPLASSLRPALAEAAPTLRDLRPLLAELRPVARAARPFLDDLRGGLDAGARGAPAAGRLLEDMQRALVQLDDRILPMLRGSTRDQVQTARRRYLAPPDLEPALDVPVYQLLTRAVAQSASASLSATVTREQSARTPGNPGAAKAFRFGGELLTGLGAPEQPCGALPVTIRDHYEQLRLCDNPNPPPPGR